MATVREKLKQKYGKAPVQTPVQPTGGSVRAQLEAKYKNKPIAPEKESLISSTKPLFPASMGGAGSILPNLAKTAGNIPSSARNLVRYNTAPVNPFDLESPMNIGSNLVKSAVATKDIFKTGGFVGGLKAIASGVVDTAKKGVDIYKGVGEKIYSNLEKNTEQQNSVPMGVTSSGRELVEKVAKVGIEDPLLIPSIIYAPSKVRGTGIKTDTISKFAKPFTGGADTSLSNIAKTLTKQSEAQIEKAIMKQFEKGVKPLLPAKTTPNLLNKYRDDVLDATKTINENKANLSFADDASDDITQAITGKNPESLQQLSDSVEQTKKVIFKKYNDLAKQSGQAGLEIDTAPIIKDLDNVIGNEALKITNPKVIEYAKDLQRRLSQVDDLGRPVGSRKLDALTTQDVIQNYNKSLEAFYRNPTYDTASQAAVDALVVNKFRQSLDDGITGLTGSQYGALKKQYGSLKAIERDVIKATLRDARKNVKGLIDFTDIFSGGQVVSGIATLNPSLVASGLTQKMIASFYKHLNNPNRAIKNLFKSVEKLPQRLPSKNLLPSQAPNIQSASIKNIIPKTVPQKLNPTKYVERHFLEAQDVLRETPVDDLNRLGGTKAIVERIKTNIVDDLNYEKYTDLANKIKTLDINKYPTVEAFKEAIEKITNKAPSLIENLKSFPNKKQ